ncbi:MAG TPA: PaaI family thioesterase [Stellaceae bacterium]|nr:PaaI family thioesterase [Stellaceae bacterium]
MTDTNPLLTTHLTPHARALGLEHVAIGKAEATLKVPYRAELVGDPDTGVIAGGVVTTLLDQVCGQAVFAALDAPRAIATLDLRIDYTRPAKPNREIFAHAHCYRMTRTVAFVRASAYDEDAKDPVATAQAVFMLTSGEPMAQSSGRG